MKAIYINPALKSVELIEISTDVDDWKQQIGAQWLDHQTLSTELGLLAVLDDEGLAKGLPEFTIFASVMNTRISLAGETLVVKSLGEDWVDATEADIQRIDVCF